MEENTIISEEIIETTEEFATEESVNTENADNCDTTTFEKVTSDMPTEAEDTQDKAVGIDYNEVARRDIEALRSEFPELRELGSITELDNPMRYAALRDMGLEPREAYLATTKRVRKTDTRSHLTAAAPKSAHSPSNSIYGEELNDARALFSDMTDSEIQNLYRKVTK